MSGDPQPPPAKESEAVRRQVRQAVERTAAKLPSERDLAAADSAWAEIWGAAVVPSEAARQILARSLAQARAEGRAAGWLAGCEGVLKEVAQARAEEREAFALDCASRLGEEFAQEARSLWRELGDARCFSEAEKYMVLAQSACLVAGGLSLEARREFFADCAAAIRRRGEG